MRNCKLGMWLLFLAAPSLSQAGPQVSVGLNFGGPAYRPHYHHYHPAPWYYRPAVVVAPAPIYYQPAPVVIQRQVVVEQQPTYVVPSNTTLAPVASSPVTTVSGYQGNVDHYLGQLSNQDDNVRQSAVMELGRMKADRAVDSLTATLAGDRSPTVREASARALGLIGSTRALTALTYAVQADNDRDVRRSAEFAIEVIQSNVRR